jgi:hypothetical protein
MDRPDRCGRGGICIEVTVGGHLDSRWASAFPGLELRTEGSESVLVGRVRDDTELYAVLARIRDLALPLTSLVRLSDVQAARPAHREDHR